MNACVAKTVRLFSTCAAVIVGTAPFGWFALPQEKLSFSHIGLAPAKADAANVAVAPTLSGSDFPICHSSGLSSSTSSYLRLAQTRTEVPPAEMQAATRASPDFA